MSEPEFIADEENHRYTLSGKRLWSITDTLAAEGFADYSFLSPANGDFYKQRGKAVHLVTQLIDDGRLDWSSLVETVSFNGGEKPWTKGYAEAYERAKIELKLEPIIREKPFYDPVYLFAGRPDWYGKTARGDAVIQIKTGGIEDWVGLQTAAEQQLLERAGYKVRFRSGLSLLPDGTYARREFSDKGDLRIFLSALACLKWKLNHGKEQSNGSANWE